MITILWQSRLARTNNFDILNDEDWILVAKKIKKEFPIMKGEQLERAIQNGIRGKYDDPNLQQPPINFKTIYKWIKKVEGKSPAGTFG